MKIHRFAALGLMLSLSLCFYPSAVKAKNLLKNPPTKDILSNGMTFIYQKDDSSATSVVNILIKGGKRGEPKGKEGVAFLTTRLCLELPDQQLLQRLMNQATNRTYLCRHDFSLIKISCLSEHLEEAIKLSMQILKDPLISGIRIERIKDFMNHYRKLHEDEPVNAAHTTALESLFSGSPYAGSVYGTQESLKKIKKRDVEDYFHTYVKSSNMIVSVSTNLEKEKTLTIMQPYMEEFPEGNPLETVPISLAPPMKKSSFLEKDIKQTLVFMAFPLPEISRENFVLATMLQNLLGKGMNSKLWSLRTEKKLAYIVNARAFPMAGGGMLEVYLETDQAKKETAFQELNKIIQNLFHNGISAEEFNATKILSKGMIIREIETKDAKTYNLAFMEATGMGYDFLNELLSDIERTTLEQFQSYIQRILDPERALSISVGPKQRP
jgi:zinc protease